MTLARQSGKLTTCPSRPNSPLAQKRQAFSLYWFQARCSSSNLSRVSPVRTPRNACHASLSALSARANHSPPHWLHAALVPSESEMHLSYSGSARTGEVSNTELTTVAQASSRRMVASRLLRPVHAVPRVAEAGHDVAMVVEMVVDRRGEHRHVRLRLREALDALGGGQEAEIAEIDRAARFQLLHCRDRRIGGRQHRIDNNHQPVGEVARRLEEIFHRLERDRVAVEPDVGDTRGGHEIEHAVEQPVAGAQYRGEDQLLSLQRRRLHRRQRCLDLDRRQLKVARHLVAQKQRYLAQQPPESRRRRLLLAHDGELVLLERVCDDGDALHVVSPVFVASATDTTGKRSGETPAGHN